MRTGREWEKEVVQKAGGKGRSSGDGRCLDCVTDGLLSRSVSAQEWRAWVSRFESRAASPDSQISHMSRPRPALARSLYRFLNALLAAGTLDVEP